MRLIYSCWLVVCVGCAIGLCIWLAKPAERQPQPVWDCNDLALPAPADIQELLNRLEPEPRIAVDGRIGPKTMEKWNRVYCEISAKQYYK